MMRLSLALPIFRAGSSFDAAGVLRSHTVSCRFLDLHDVTDLDPRPDRAVLLGNVTWAIWPTSNSITGDEMAVLQLELREDLAGDPSWDGAVTSLTPIAGVTYPVGAEELEAIELKVPRA
jgi:hypothetical protein